MQAILNNLSKIQGEISFLGDLKESREGEIFHLQERLSKVEKYEELFLKASEMLTKVAEESERGSKQVIEGLVSHGLRVIFGEQEPFRVLLETKSKSVYGYLGLGEEKEDIIDNKGGGYVDLISVLFVLVLLLQEKPAMRRFLVLDESFSDAGREHLPRVGEFLRYLVDKLGVTILMVTHAPELVEFAHIVYEVSKPGDETLFKKVEVN